MSFNKWPKRSAEKNYFMVPNEIFSIGLDFREISLYSYLLRCENRKTYQCYPSYKTIGHAIGMSENTVAKYVRQLEEKGLIYTEPTMVRSKDGRPLNGNLLYTVRPIQGVLEAFYERQLRQAEEAAARCRVAELLKKSNAQGRQNALCAPFREEASPSPDQGIEAGCEPFSADFCGTKEKAGYDEERAIHWLTRSAEQGNQYAQYLLNHLEENRPPSAMLAVTRLLHHMSRIFRDNSVPKSRPGGIQIDRKRLKKLQEKRMALGHKPDDHEEQWPDMTM